MKLICIALTSCLSLMAMPPKKSSKNQDDDALLNAAMAQNQTTQSIEITNASFDEAFDIAANQYKMATDKLVTYKTIKETRKETRKKINICEWSKLCRQAFGYENDTLHMNLWKDIFTYLNTNLTKSDKKRQSIFWKLFQHNYELYENPQRQASDEMIKAYQIDNITLSISNKYVFFKEKKSTDLSYQYLQCMLRTMRDEPFNYNIFESLYDIFEATLPKRKPSSSEHRALSIMQHNYAQMMLNKLDQKGPEGALTQDDEERLRSASNIYYKASENNIYAIRKLACLIRSNILYYDKNGNKFKNKEDRDKTIKKLYQKAAKQGDATDQFRLALMIKSRDFDQDENGKQINTTSERNEAAGKLYQKAAQQGIAAAQSALAGMIKIGTFDQDENQKLVNMASERNEAAGKLYQKAIKKGETVAQYCLAVMIERREFEQDENGKPVNTALERNEAAGKLYQKAVKQGFAEAQLYLARMIERGIFDQDENGEQVDESNTNKVIGKLYQKAAQQGIAEAQSHLAEMIERGIFDQDENGKQVDESNKNEVAGKLYQKAIKKGDAIASAKLAVIIGKGIFNQDENGKPVNTASERNEAAGKLYQKAAQQGIAIAQANLALNIQQNIFHEDMDGNKITSDDDRDAIAFNLIKESTTNVDNNLFEEIINKYIAASCTLELTPQQFTTLIQNINELTKELKKDKEYFLMRAHYLAKQPYNLELANQAIDSGHSDALFITTRWEKEYPPTIEESIDPRSGSTSSEDQISKTTHAPFDELTVEVEDNDSEAPSTPTNIISSSKEVAQGESQTPEDLIAPSKKIKSKTDPQKLREATQSAQKALRQTQLMQANQQVPCIITWTKNARKDLESLKGPEKERLSHIVEAFKSFDCVGAFKGEILKKVKIDHKKVFSIRLNAKDRVCVTREYNKKGDVTQINMLTIRGHYDHLPKA